MLVLALIATLLVMARISGRVESILRVSPTYWPSQVRVVDVSRSSVTIEEVEDGPTWLTAGQVYGLEWQGGSGQVGRVLSDEGDTVERTFRLLDGTRPEVGTLARYSREAYPRDAERAFADEDVREVSIPGPRRPLPAWFAPGTSSTWAVLVHGRGSARSEMFRLMRSTRALGLPSLNITYRGDPETGGGEASIGLDEWRDLESAVRFAQKRGASDVVLLGASMGGSVIASFLERSDLADSVSAIVLDSPLLDFGYAVDDAARRAFVPGPLVSASMWLAEQRTGLDFDDVDYLDDTSWLTVPALVIHGTADTTVPVATSQRLAESAPDRVEARIVEGAGHVESWNADPQRYDDWVQDFLEPFAAG